MPEVTLYNDTAENILDKMIEEKVKVDAIITDPPFNIVEKMGGSIHLFRQSAKDTKEGEEQTYSEETMDYDIGFDQLGWLSRISKVLKKGGHLILFNDWENMGDIAKELRKYKINVKSLNHWQKVNPQPAEWKRRFVPGREYFLHAIKPGKYTFNIEEFQAKRDKKMHFGNFEIPLTPNSEKRLGKHPNQKPIRLMEELVEILTNEGDTVLDCFMGSGSTGVACINLNRNFIGVEKEFVHFKLSEKRTKEALDKKINLFNQGGK